MTPRKSAIKTNLFAADFYQQKLDQLGDPLLRIASCIDFPALAAEVDRVAPCPASSQGGRPLVLAPGYGTGTPPQKVRPRRHSPSLPSPPCLPCSTSMSVCLWCWIATIGHSGGILARGGHTWSPVFSLLTFPGKLFRSLRG